MSWQQIPLYYMHIIIIGSCFCFGICKARFNTIWVCRACTMKESVVLRSFLDLKALRMEKHVCKKMPIEKHIMDVSDII